MLKSGQAWTVEFVTSAATGAAANADSLPAGVLIVNGVDNAAVVTVTNVATGRYKAAVTLPALTDGEVVEMGITATIGGVAAAGVVAHDTAYASMAADIVDAVWDEVLTAATHNVAASAGRRLRQVAAPIIVDGTAVSATENTITLDADASTTDGAYDPALIFIATGPGSGQCRLILDYAGAGKVATVDRDWKVTPTDASTYVIMGDAGREHVNEGLAVAGGASTITLNAAASAEDDAYVGQRVFIRSGTGQDQARRVSAYNGTTKVATLSRPWDVVPDETSAYVMLPTGAITDSDIATAVWDALMASYSDAGTTGRTLSDAGGTGSGFGANTVTVTVTGDGSPLQDASVRLTKSGVSYVLATSALGVATFSLDAGTYAIAVSLAGWAFTPTSVVVDGDEAVAAAMSQVVIPAPTEPDACVVYAYARDIHGAAEASVPVVFRLEAVDGLEGSAFAGETHSVTSAADGLVQVQLPQGARASVFDRNSRWRAFDVPAAASYELPAVIV